MHIGLIPMSAKPYHAGHHALVVMAANENDLVKVFVSLSDRKRPGEMPLLGSSMRTIWSQYLEPVMPDNVEIVYGGAPVQKVYAELAGADEAESKDVYTIYSDPQDTARNYPEANRLKYFPGIYENGQVLFAAEVNPRRFTRGEGTPNVSGTKMRAAIGAGDFDTFQKGMPPGVDAHGIFDILRPKMTAESILRAFIRRTL